MAREIIYQYIGALDRGFSDLRIMWEKDTSLVTLYYDTPQAVAYGSVLQVDAAIEFLERMKGTAGYPWRSTPTREAMDALMRLQATMRKREQGPAIMPMPAIAPAAMSPTDGQFAQREMSSTDIWPSVLNRALRVNPEGNQSRSTKKEPEYSGSS